MYPNLLEWKPGYHLSSYHAFLLIGYVAILALAIRRRRYLPGFDRTDVFIGVTFYFLSALLGAKILHVMLYWSDYRENLLASTPLRGGFAYLGTWLGIASLWVFSAFKKASFVRILDFAAPLMMLNQAFNRIGCFLNGCCWGSPSGLPWATVFPDVDNIPRHPTQIYSSAALFLLYFALNRLYRNNRQHPGKTLLYMLLFYCSYRLPLEFLRTDSPVIAPGYKFSQVFCLGIIIAAASGLACYDRKLRA